MKASRIVPTVLVIGVAAFLAFRGCAGRARDAAEPKEPETPPAAPGDPGQFPTLSGPAVPAPPPKAHEPAPPAASEADPAPGTPVKDGAEVSLVVPYRTGTKSRYRVSDAKFHADRDTNAVQAWRFQWDVSTEVLAGDGSGPARIRFQIDSFEFDTTDPIGRPLKFRSADPDKKLLADKQFARSLNPMTAILGMPVEFVIGAGGDITAVEGVNALNRTFLDLVDALGAEFSKDLSDAPTAESLTQKWSEILFPPLGGGTLKAGAARDVAFRTTYFDRWSEVTSGQIRVTNDDPDSFRVEFKGKPDIEELNRPAVNASAVGVAKIRAAASKDCVTAAWRFDRKTGRLVRGELHSKYRMDVSNSTPGEGTGFTATYTDVERQIVTECLDK